MRKFLVLITLFTSAVFAQADDEQKECHKIAIVDLHPTQVSVGYREVSARIEKIKAMSEDKLKKYLKKNPAPVVIGPEKKRYIFDHQHLAVALLGSDVKEMCSDVQDDLSGLAPADFWKELEKRNWVYLFDNNDQAITPDQLPEVVSKMVDDPYRSLAWAVREAGDYDKSDAPFAEFQWAHFFRSRVAVGSTDAQFDAAVVTARSLAHSAEAKNLPGYRP